MHGRNTAPCRRNALIPAENVLYRGHNEQTPHRKLPLGSPFFRGAPEEPSYRGVRSTRKQWPQKRVIGRSRKRPPTNLPPPVAGGLRRPRAGPPVVLLPYRSRPAHPRTDME